MARKPGHMLNMNVGAITKSFDKASPEEKAEFVRRFKAFADEAGIADMLDMGAAPDEPQVTNFDPVAEAEARAEDAPEEPATEPEPVDERPKFHDYSDLRKRLEQNIARLEKNMDRGVDVFNSAVRVYEINEAIQRSKEAEHIPSITRRYGCQHEREMVTMEGLRPESPIVFTRYTFETSDPLEIAYIEHRRRMREEALANPTSENQMWRSSAEIQDIGDKVAVVSFQYRSDFAGFMDKSTAEEMERRELVIAARRVRAV